MNDTQAIERYMEAAGRGLAAATQAELRAMLMDSLQARGLDPARAEDQAEVAAALSEFGKPEKIARELYAAGYAIETENK